MVTDEELISLAAEARERAYAPYSHFAVGAALLAKSGKIYTACNVENVSYGLSVCAERAAVFKAVSEGEREFEAIAVVTEKGKKGPCGACRQVLSEFSEDMRVIMADEEGAYRVLSLRELLPDAFTPADLSRGQVS
ncbi:MAG: cytidine deaminase [Chloroflexota bacterium]|nr:cytidine deaminase [Chloroflexota bacterium]